MFLTYIYITLLLPSFVLTLCICLDYFIEGHRVISYTSTVTCYPLKIKSLPFYHFFLQDLKITIRKRFGLVNSTFPAKMSVTA